MLTGLVGSVYLSPIHTLQHPSLPQATCKPVSLFKGRGLHEGASKLGTAIPKGLWSSHSSSAKCVVTLLGWSALGISARVTLNNSLLFLGRLSKVWIPSGAGTHEAALCDSMAVLGLVYMGIAPCEHSCTAPELSSSHTCLALKRPGQTASWTSIMFYFLWFFSYFFGVFFGVCFFFSKLSTIPDNRDHAIRPRG